MEKNRVFLFILILIVLTSIAVPLMIVSFPGGVIGSGDFSVEHNDIMGGNSNPIKIKANFSIQEVQIYLNGSLKEYNYFENDAIAPDAVYAFKGGISGNKNDLNAIDGKGLTATPCRNFCGHYWRTLIYVAFDSSRFNGSENEMLRFSFNSQYNFDMLLYYYSFSEHDWISLANSSSGNFTGEYGITKNMICGDHIYMLISAKSMNYFSYLIDQFAINKEFSSEKLINLDVSDLDDGLYEMGVNIFDYSFNKFTYNASILIDNTAPIIAGNLPSGIYNETEKIDFNITINDVSQTISQLIMYYNGNYYYSADFNDSKNIYYYFSFLPGNYSYIIISSDESGNTAYYCGNFTVLNYTKIIIKENTIMLSIPSSVGPDCNNYTVNITITGSYNYTYNITVINAVNNTLGNIMLQTNNSGSINLNSFNESLTLRIYNVNKSSLVYEENFTVIKFPYKIRQMQISVSHPEIVSEEEYSITLLISEEPQSGAIFVYEIYGDDGDLIISGNLQNNIKTEVKLDKFDENLKLIILKNGEPIYINNFDVEKLEIKQEKKLSIDLNVILIIISIGSLIVATMGLIYTIYRDKRLEDV
ncbi:MAG: hypothetical protein ACTSRP_09335 [Candidatus Helarchaeota archaeon]